MVAATTETIAIKPASVIPQKGMNIINAKTLPLATATPLLSRINLTLWLRLYFCLSR